MADFRGLEMANGYRNLGVAKVRGERRKVRDRFRCLSAAAVFAVTTVALLMSVICFWNQRKLEEENGILMENVLALESKMESVQAELTKAKDESDDFSDSNSPDFVSIHRRLKRSNRNGEQKQRRARDLPRAIHFRLDVEDTTATQLKWKAWSATEATNGRTKRSEPKYQLNNAVRLSDDRTYVTIDETGLYFIYAQIHFENAKSRNAFAVKVNDSAITKCFQSLDYFNRSLTPADNSRFKPCYSAASVVLHRNQVVSVVNLYPSHRVYMDPVANFWGLVKLAD